MRETSLWLGRTLPKVLSRGDSQVSFPVRARMGASVARFVALQAFSAAYPYPPLGEHLPGVGLQLQRVLEDRLDAVRLGRHHTAGLLRCSQVVLDGQVDQLSQPQ